MPNYRVGDIIRMTRLSMGMSQEKLSENICSVQTLSRIENGKCSVKRDVYRQLMERMGRNGEKSFAPLAVEDFDLLEDMERVNTYLSRHDYENVERELIKLRAQIGDEMLNVRYVKRKQMIVDYRMGRITKTKFLEGLEELIALTIPDYESLLDKVFPFMDEEIQLLLNIAGAYGELGENEKQISILNMLLRSIAAEYIGEGDAVQLKIMLMNNLAKAYGESDEHQTAIKISEEAIGIAKQYKLVRVLPNLYFEAAWNMIQQIEKGLRKAGDLEKARRYLRQGYAVGAISGKVFVKEAIERYYKEYFQEEIYFCSSPIVGEEPASSIS